MMLHHRGLVGTCLGLVTSLILSSQVKSADPEAVIKGPIPVETVKLNRPIDYNIDIKPILKKNCVACHYWQRRRRRSFA